MNNTVKSILWLLALLLGVGSITLMSGVLDFDPFEDIKLLSENRGWVLAFWLALMGVALLAFTPLGRPFFAFVYRIFGRGKSK